MNITGISNTVCNAFQVHRKVYNEYPHLLSEIFECSNIVEISVVGLLANPKVFSKGLILGIFDRYFSQLILNLSRSFFPKAIPQKIITQETISPSETEKLFCKVISPIDSAINTFRSIWDVRDSTKIAPIQEEIQHRFLIQKTLIGIFGMLFNKLSGKSYLGNRIKFEKEGIVFCGYQFTAKKIAILITAVHFLAAHKHKPLINKIAEFPGVVLFGMLAESDGIVGSIAAHMMYNTLTYDYYFSPSLLQQIYKLEKSKEDIIVNNLNFVFEMNRRGNHPGMA